jgi:hypothetical protein
MDSVFGLPNRESLDGGWKPYEIAALTRAVRETFGTGGPSPDLSAAEVREGWRKVAKAVPTRTSQQIRDRWRLGKDHV